MKIKEDILTGILGILAIVLIYVCFVSDARGGNPHHYVTETRVIELQPVVTYETNVTEQVNITELVNTTNIEHYSPDQCQGVAIAQAGANNQMYMGTKKGQLSLGVGECNGDMASSLMFGARVNANLFLNGSWATDNEVNAFGVGATWIFK